MTQPRKDAGRAGAALLSCAQTAVALTVLFASSPAAAQFEPEPPPPVERWYEALDLGLFADAYASFNTNRPPVQTSASRFRVNDGAAGFALSWAGVDAGYEPDPVGGRVSLRFGPTTSTLCGDSVRGDCLDEEHRVVTQAFASWRPGGGAWTFDFGKFYTPYGAEAAESQDNLNYSRGLLYSLAQPRFHTGMRVTARLAESASLSGLLVNGWDNSFDDNGGKSPGLVGQWTPSPNLVLKLGWLGGPEQSAARAAWRKPRAWRHLVDFTVGYDPFETLRLVLDATWVREGPTRRANGGDRWRAVAVDWYGAAVGAEQALSSMWALAVRAEYLADPDGFAVDPSAPELVSGTLTLQATPSDHLILRLEHRGDVALDAEGSRRLFAAEAGERRTYQVTSTLGVVVTSD